MKQKQYIVDAFTDRVFEGNPAAVCIMKEWLPDDIMQQIAIENNLSETAFAVKEDNGYKLRWFTPGKEVDLCGHATLGTAFVLANFYDTESTHFTFHTLSGPLNVKKDGELFEMDFPSRMPKRIDVTEEMLDALGKEPAEAYLGRDLMFVYNNEEFVINYNPDWSKLCSIQEGMGVLITAPSKEYDFVSRCFFPKIKVNEDPVCGSAHCNFIPYWAKKLGQKTLTARQVSRRGGTLFCEDQGDRVLIKGKAALYSESIIYLPPFI